MSQRDKKYSFYTKQYLCGLFPLKQRVQLTTACHQAVNQSSMFCGVMQSLGEFRALSCAVVTLLSRFIPTLSCTFFLVIGSILFQEEIHHGMAVW